MEKFWTTDRLVYSVVPSPDGKTTYIGGDFTRVGPYTGHGVPISVESGQSMGTFPKVNDGTVLISIPDGQGGWYIGGTFSKINNLTRNKIAHTLQNGSVDPNFNPSFSGVGVNSLYLDSTRNLLYVGGEFSSIGGQTRNNLAGITTSTGIATSWNPNVTGNDGSYTPIVNAIAFDSANGLIYIGGLFTSVGGQSRQRIAAINTTTGLATGWNPNISDNTPSIKALSLNSASGVLYAAGLFNFVGAQPRKNIAAIDISTGLATSWDPGANYTVFTLALDSASGLLYTGGQFSVIGGQSRARIAAISTATGLATNWNPSANGDVFTISQDSAKNLVYIGGKFTSAGGQSRNEIAAIDTTTDLATSWNPGANDEVHTLALNPNRDVIYVGGWFSSVGGKIRNHIAAIDNATGQLTDWNPDANSGINVMAMDPTRNQIYVAGGFTSIGGQPRFLFATIDTTTGLATNWDVKVDLGVASMVLDQARHILYIGGQFNTVDSQPRYRIASLDVETKQLTDWNPGTSPVATIGSLVLDPANHLLYVGGQFTAIANQTRKGAAAFDTTTGQLTNWDPEITCLTCGFSKEGFVASIVVGPTDGNPVYVGGTFSEVGSLSRNRVAAIDNITGIATGWNANLLDPNSNVFTLSLDNRFNKLYVGGNFSSSVGGKQRNNFVALDTTTGIATAWNPNPNYSVFATALDQVNNLVYFGGNFTSIGGQARRRFAVFATQGVIAQ